MRSKVAVVAQREFLATIRTKSYLIITLGMPFFMVILGAIALISPLYVASKESKLRTVGIVDLSGVLGLDREIEFSPPMPPLVETLAGLDSSGPREMGRIAKAFENAMKVKLAPFPSREAAQEAVRRDEISAALEFPMDYMATGQVLSYQKGTILPGTGAESREGLIRRFVIERLLAGRLDETLMERVRRPLRMSAFVLDKSGRFEPQDLLKQVGAFVVPLVFTMVFFLSVMMSSGFLIQGVSEEKENRVIEVILSSISSDGLLLGKLIGLGGAGLLQVAIWFGLVLLPAAKLIVKIPLHPWPLIGSFVFYLLGFLLFGVLLTGTGSLGQNLKESQQYGMVWSLGSVIPMMFMTILLQEPNGTFARILSFVPLTAPVTMFLRLSSPEPPALWEVLLAAAVLAAATWASLKVMAKIFRVGLLLYGKRPSIPEIIRLVRRPAA